MLEEKKPMKEGRGERPKTPKPKEVLDAWIARDFAGETIKSMLTKKDKIKELNNFKK